MVSTAAPYAAPPGARIFLTTLYMASQSDGGSIVVSPVDGSTAFRAGLRARRGALGGEGMELRESSMASDLMPSDLMPSDLMHSDLICSVLTCFILTPFGDNGPSDLTVSARRRFLTGRSTTSSMSRISDLISSVFAVARANRARDDRVVRLGGETGSDTRSNSFAASLETLELRIM